MGSNNEDRLLEFGIPTDALQGFVSEQLALHAQAAASPAGRWLQENEPGLRAYLGAHPDVAGTFGRMAQADGLGAVEFLAMRYQRDGGGGGAGGGDRPEPQGPYVGAGRVFVHATDGEKARQDAYVRARLRSVISDEFLHQ